MAIQENLTTIEPVNGPLVGSISVPGDKSISHRAVLFAAMAEGTSRLSGVLDSEDVRSSLGAVSKLGAKVNLEKAPDGSLYGGITGWGAKGPSAPSDPIDCGNSGTTTRLLMGILAPWDIEVSSPATIRSAAAPCAAFRARFRGWARSFCPKAKTRCRLRFMARATSKRSITMRLLHRLR